VDRREQIRLFVREMALKRCVVDDKSLCYLAGFPQVNCPIALHEIPDSKSRSFPEFLRISESGNQEPRKMGQKNTRGFLASR
jgi:hypothetical protein